MDGSMKKHIVVGSKAWFAYLDAFSMWEKEMRESAQWYAKRYGRGWMGA